MRVQEMIGKKFGMLTVIGIADKSDSRNRKFLS